MSNAITVSNKALSKLTTPQILKGGLYLTWGASLLLLVTIISGVQGQRHAIKTVGKDAAPSIINAQRIKDSLADLDANAANELLVKPGQNPEASKAYEYRRQKLARLLVNVAENISYGDAERKPIETVQVGLTDYITKIQRARDFNERGDTAGVLTAYRSAAEVMDKTLLPATDELDKANSQILESVYAEARFTSGRSLFFIVMSGFLVIGVLVAIQLFLYHRMRRILNPWLLGATAIAVIFLGHTVVAFITASHHLKVAKEDAFTSLHALRQARAVAYSANADESRYLLDAALAPIHQQNFFQKVDEIAKVPNGQTFETLIATLKQSKTVPGFTGFLADQANNISFAGEREAALATISAFSTYLNIDKQIRQLEQSGKHIEAIALCTGYDPGQSNWAFEQFKKAHSKVSDINLKAFDKAVEQGFKDVNGFEVTTPVVVAAIASLTLFGMLPRIKEYSV